MSYNRFLASNKMFKKLENPLIRTYTMIEAKELGYIESIPINTKKPIDPNKPFMFIVKKEEDFCEPEIYPVDEIEKGYIEETLKSYSKKNYFAQIDFRYTKKRANKIIDYMKEHLNECDEVELWSTWFDNYEPATTIYKTIDDITINDIKKFDDWNDNSPYCIVVTKNKYMEKL